MARPRKTAPPTKDMTVLIVATPDLKSLFEGVAIDGQGGFQLLCRTVAERIKTSGSVIRFSLDEFKRITRYATIYGEGGYQRRMRIIVSHWAAQNVDKIVSR